ncbi:class I SAM-dependent methyltransferase [Ohtaekwangia koreensis]|uniref:Methyltransferase domain-containing protein n=1 Tax=Ohtaekwangia koreensis TaxID=688867 RepID=A0A1T5MFS7_9BACT|nr:class I SAM-dependent methyltransferase [Ohtaekwangia koreensis]SKC87087.1 Methyltransferase domain-containing protein [Ohtaekwangia koreensis]
MINFIIYVLKRFAWFKRLNAKITYEILAKYIPASNWQFMNYGYIATKEESKLCITQHQGTQFYPLCMYHYLASMAEIRGKHILEVGSGRGGGAKHVTSFFSPSLYIGMDLAQSAVDLASKLHNSSNLKFIQGSAESIPLADNSVDVVLNVESSHAYGSVEKFLDEVRRVLKPGGYLLLVDFRSKENMAVFKEQLLASGLDCLGEEDISDNVVRSIEAEDENKKKHIESLVPPRWQKLFNEFAGVVGSKFHCTLKDRSRLYYRFVLQKSAMAA